MNKPPMQPTKSKVYWNGFGGLFPYHIGFCPNEKVWHSEMKRLGLSSVPYPMSDAQCSHFVNDGLKGGACSIITMSAKPKSSVGVIGLLAHEAKHAWREMCKHMGEETPSAEFEAYMMQNIIIELILAYQTTRGKILSDHKPVRRKS